MDKTLLKGLKVIEALGQGATARGVSDLAAELELTKSNAHRVLKTLESAGYVLHDAGTGRYRLSLKVWELGSRLVSRLDFKREAPEVMERLMLATRETVHLSILAGDEVVYVDKIDGPEPVRAYSAVGGRAPAYAVATGKVLLAYHPSDLVQQFANDLIPYTENTLKSADELYSELGRVRSQGYAVNNAEYRDSVSGIAAPIFALEGNVIAAIGISGPSMRFGASHVEHLAPHVVSAAKQISARLGYRA